MKNLIMIQNCRTVTMIKDVIDEYINEKKLELLNSNKINERIKIINDNIDTILPLIEEEQKELLKINEEIKLLDEKKKLQKKKINEIVKSTGIQTTPVKITKQSLEKELIRMSKSKYQIYNILSDDEKKAHNLLSKTIDAINDALLYLSNSDIDNAIQIIETYGFGMLPKDNEPLKPPSELNIVDIVKSKAFFSC